MTTAFKKWLFYMAVAMITTPTLFAQDNGRLEGRIDEGQNLPLASTTVTLVDLLGKIASRTTATDSSGRFMIDKIPYGLFACKISHTGYQPITRDSILFSPAKVIISLSGLTMIPSGRILAEVTVSARSAIIRNAPDKKVFAVNQSLVSLGGSAADLLQNVPTLQVDADGNVSLRGAADLKVLVDGKHSLIGGAPLPRCCNPFRQVLLTG